jgi:2,4-dienoyl-CoA reductase-like NADH-dependent reductase (Old Yellow Enzyme family)
VVRVPQIPATSEPGYVTPQAIEDPWHYINLYKQAAKNALAAGFDGVELHSANGCKSQMVFQLDP